MIDKKELLQIIKYNPEGFTLSCNELCIWAAPKSGYVVAYKTLCTVKDNTIPTKIERELLLYNGYLGGWFDTDNNVYVIEKVLLIKNLNDAYFLAKALKQRYIYDLVNKKALEV